MNRLTLTADREGERADALLARLVTWFFRRHYAVAFHGILGFVIASTLVIIPAEYTGAGEMALSALCAAAGFGLAFFLARMDKRETETA